MKLSNHRMFEELLESINLNDDDKFYALVKLKAYIGIDDGVPRYLTALYHASRKIYLYYLEELLKTGEHTNFRFSRELIENWQVHDVDDVWKTFQRHLKD